MRALFSNDSDNPRGGESHASFMLHIDSTKAGGAIQRELRRKLNNNWKYIVVLLAILYFLYF